MRHHVRLVQKLKVIDIWLIVVEVVSNLPNYSCAVVLIYVYTKQSSKNVWGISIPWCYFMLGRYLINKIYLVFVYSVFRKLQPNILWWYDTKIAEINYSYKTPQTINFVIPWLKSIRFNFRWWHNIFRTLQPWSCYLSLSKTDTTPYLKYIFMSGWEMMTISQLYFKCNK